MPHRAVRVLLIGVGILAVALAVAGLFLPVLPTTPFLLVAAACFARSSPSLHRWLYANRWFGTYLRNYREHHGVELRHKIIALGMLWTAIGYAAVAAESKRWLQALLLGIAASVTIHLAMLRTLRPEHDRRHNEHPYEFHPPQRTTASGRVPTHPNDPQV